MSFVSSRRTYSILGKPFFALVLLTIMFALTVTLPRILSPTRNPSMISYGLYGFNVSISYVNGSLVLNLTNSYKENIAIMNITICNTTISINETLSPGENKTLTIPYDFKSTWMCLVRIRYIWNNRLYVIYRTMYPSSP